MSTNSTQRRVHDTGILRRRPEKGTRVKIVRALGLIPLVLGMGLTLLSTELDAQNVSVTDYSVPISRADNLRIDVLSLNYVTEGEDAVVQTGNLGVVYKKFYDSLPFAYSMDLITTASFNKGAADELAGDLATNLVTRIKRYTPPQGNIFIFGDTDFDFEDSFDRPAVDMTLGFGYGRFINATALRKAVRIEEMFLDEGIISERLPKEPMIELGHIIEREQEYKDLYGDRSYRNYWFEDMTNQITKSGLVLGDVGFGILRMQEVLFQEQINERFYGWEATAGIQFEVLTPEEGQGRSDPSFSAGFRYSRPISWSTQINARFSATTPFTGDFGRVYSIIQTTDFVYEFTNKVSFAAAHRFRADKQRGMDAMLSTNISFALNFFLENKVNLTASEQIATVEGEPFRQSFNFGLSYRIF